MARTGLTRVKLNGAGVRKLLRGPETVKVLEDMARSIAATAGPGHEVATQIGPHRARVRVITATPSAMWHEATRRSLTRALDAARR